VEVPTARLLVLVLWLGAGLRSGFCQPSVAITNFSESIVYSLSARLNLKAAVSDSGGHIVSVRFLLLSRGDPSGTTIGIVTNPPYTLLWTNVYGGYSTVGAEATDDAGASATSAPVGIYLTLGPPDADLYITTPLNNVSVSPFESVVFHVRPFAIFGNVQPVHFFIDGNMVADIYDPPYQINVGPLAIGKHRLSVTYPGFSISSNGVDVVVVPLKISAPALGGIATPFSFDVQTAITNQPIIIEASSNLTSWFPIFTNGLPTNTFHFTGPVPDTAPIRYYRARTPH